MGTRYTFMMSRDTTSEAARIRFSALAELTGEERLREALALSDLVAALAEAGRRDRAKTEGCTANARPAPLRR
jgi:hypothetical protein